MPITLICIFPTAAAADEYLAAIRSLGPGWEGRVIPTDPQDEGVTLAIQTPWGSFRCFPKGPHSYQSFPDIAAANEFLVAIQSLGTV